MKKYIVWVICMCVLLVTPTFAQSLQDNANYLVDLLGRGKQTLSVQEQYDFRTHRVQLLDAAKNTSTKKDLIVAVQAAIQTRIENITSQHDRPEVKKQFDTLINQLRSVYKLWPLQYVDALDTVAQNYADYIQTTDHFDHISLSGESIEQRITTVDYDYRFLGENLAKWYDSITGVVKWRMDSPTHRANLLFPQYTDMWLGRAGDYRVHLFGSTQ